ncbi:type III secretion system gatekeeper subunit SctW [Acerihabitans arboris]|uniref:YopN family type III secretion system gatekeeper subunit n=1 Tax=Acerihabitans arboris TaxID=2691583 RepID=A0A845SEL4_9GAMM|nr:type III secretion system gatekeeper subunit SctW [Acerihabitans arboris]NDL61526.1 YopN family type III secretion system gatekeeper subunit [Acerihabitans arboris]
MAVNATGGIGPAALFTLPDARTANRQPGQDMSANVRVKRSAATLARQAEQSFAKGGAAAASQFASRRQYEKYERDTEINFARILDDDAIPKVEQLLRILNDGKLSQEPSLLSYARALFPDDSDLVVVLREILRRRKLKEAVGKALAALLAQVEAQADPQHLNAGINCALKARLFGQAHLDLAPAMLRGSYRRFLQSDRQSIEEYQEWISCYGHQYRSTILAFIEAALMADAYAATPSSGSVYGDFCGKLGQLRLIRSGDDLFMKQLISNEVIVGLNKSEPDWLIFLFSLLQSPEDIDEHLHYLLGEEFLLYRHHERSAILQPIFRTCRLLPHELFFCAETAQRMFRQFEYLAGLAYKREVIESRMNR